MSDTRIFELSEERTHNRVNPSKLNEKIEKVKEELKVGTINEADEHLKYNEYIIRGYRIQFNSSKKLIKRY